jgi:APA family basic amino acid/polyamine antiporter
MARDGVIVPFFAAVNPTSGAPVRAILLQSLWVSVLILTGTFEQLVIYSGFVLAAFSALTVGCVFVFRWRHPTLARPFRTPLYPITPGLFIAFSLVIVGYSLFHRPHEAVFGIATVVTGIPFYFLQRNHPGASG